MKEQLLQIKQDIIDISNDLKTNLANKGVTADGTLSELVDSVQNIDSNVLAEIGWNLVEQPFLKDAIDYAKEIYKNPKNTYSNDKQLIIFPKVDELEIKDYMFQDSTLTLFPDGVKMYGRWYQTFEKCYGLKKLDLSNAIINGETRALFQYCQSLQEIILPDNFGKGCTNMYAMFYNNYNLKTPITIDCSDTLIMDSCFYNCAVLQKIIITGTPKENLTTGTIFNGCSSLIDLTIPDKFPINSYAFYQCPNIEKVKGSIVYKGTHSTSISSWIMGYSANKKLRYLVVKDIGIRSTDSALNTTYSNVWGINSDSVPDARQSLIDSLITYSYDRASAGYSSMSITLYKDVKALLTEEEIAQITAKGYTLI